MTLRNDFKPLMRLEVSYDPGVPYCNCCCLCVCLTKQNVMPLWSKNLHKRKNSIPSTYIKTQFGIQKGTNRILRYASEKIIANVR